MGIINSNKSIGNITSIDCRGTLDVRLGFTAAPDIQSHPTDIVLVLDHSTSMMGQPLADLKTGVNTFIDIIADATGGAPGEIGSGSHIGIVSFSTTAVQETALITSVADLKAAAATLTAGGFTNHGAAFTEATDLLAASVNAKVIVMFTDGETTTGPNPSPIAAAAKAQDIVIYCIGLQGTGGVNVNALNDWATDPDVTHVAVAPDSSQLEQIFADLAANISVPGATNIVVNEAINPDFAILGMPVATVGTISQLTATSFRWTIDQLGTTSSESALVSFTIQHTADTSGTKLVDQSLSYTDTEGNVVSFAAPTVDVNCIPDDIRMTVVKSADKTSVSKASDDVTYTVTVSNPGNVPLTAVTVYDSIPQAMCYKPGTTRINGGAPTDTNPQSGISIGSLNPAQSVTVTFVLNICNDPCCGISVTEFVNTAWAKGTVNQLSVSAVSDPHVVAFSGHRIVKAIEKVFPACDFACYRYGHVHHIGTTYHSTPTGNAVTAIYAIAIKYIDCCGERKSKYLESSVTFCDLPANFDYSSAQVHFTELTQNGGSCGNVPVQFEAVLCYNQLP